MMMPRLPAFYRLTALDSIDSTNEEARRLADDGAAEGTLVWALEQTAGRGRRGRSWASPHGNLYLSLLLRPDCRAGVAAQLGFVAALSLAEALDPLLPGSLQPAEVKWPNDILLQGRKVAGLLLETASRPDGGLDRLVIGAGVNVATHPTDTPYPATSLAAEGATTNPAAVLEGFAAGFEAWRGRWLAEGFGPVRAAWLLRARGLGQPLTVRLDGETLEGRFAALDEDGAMLLEWRGGRRRITAGDVFYPGL
jgi:BirA family biotin operon repressor/biotin-[acetyl-CoA-carboxylase] ligase